MTSCQHYPDLHDPADCTYLNFVRCLEYPANCSSAPIPTNRVYHIGAKWNSDIIYIVAILSCNLLCSTSQTLSGNTLSPHHLPIRVVEKMGVRGSPTVAWKVLQHRLKTYNGNFSWIFFSAPNFINLPLGI